jgi:hypothetical protein
LVDVDEVGGCVVVPEITKTPVIQFIWSCFYRQTWFYYAWEHPFNFNQTLSTERKTYAINICFEDFADIWLYGFVNEFVKTTFYKLSIYEIFSHYHRTKSSNPT